VQARIDEWNKAHPGEEVKLIELSAEADQQRTSLINAARAVPTVAAVRLANNSMRSAFLARSLMPSASISRGILRLSKSRNSAVVAPRGYCQQSCDGR